MPQTRVRKAEDRLILRSQLGDLALVWPWVDALAVEHAIPVDTRFKIDLCLEEALSNIVRHGYAGEPNHSITINFTADEENGLTFTVEDSAAPPFSPLNPLTVLSRPNRDETPTSLEEIQPGGKGIPLMRKFAGSLAYEQLPEGNRLTIGFPAAMGKSTPSSSPR